MHKMNFVGEVNKTKKVSWKRTNIVLTCDLCCCFLREVKVTRLSVILLCTQGNFKLSA